MSKQKQRWQQADYGSNYHGTVHSRLLESELYYSLRSRQAAKHLFGEQVGPDSTVFEFGVGTGKNVACLANASGYDLSPFAREFSVSKGIKVFDSIEAVPEGHFDVVLSAHVLEHLEDPAANLRLLGSRLKDGGRLILVLPTERHGRVPFDVDVHQHLYTWNFRTINNLLQRTGFRVLDNRYNYGTLQYRLRHLGRLNFKLYDLSTRLFGRLLNRRDMVIVAEKQRA